MRLSRKDIASLTGKTLRTVLEWAKDATFPQPVDPSAMTLLYESEPFLHWYAVKLVGPLGSSVDGEETPDFNHFKSVKMRADAARAEAEAELARTQADLEAGRLMPSEEAYQSWTRDLKFMQTRMRAIPSRVAPRVASMDDPALINVLLETEIDTALWELAGIDFRPATDGGIGIEPVPAEADDGG